MILFMSLFIDDFGAKIKTVEILSMTRSQTNQVSCLYGFYNAFIIRLNMECSDV